MDNVLDIIIPSLFNKNVCMFGMFYKGVEIRLFSTFDIFTENTNYFDIFLMLLLEATHITENLPMNQ